MGFSRQECWSGLPCLTPGDLPDPGQGRVESVTSPALAGWFFTTSATWEAIFLVQPNNNNKNSNKNILKEESQLAWHRGYTSYNRYEVIPVPNPLDTDMEYYDWLDLIWMSTSEVREEVREVVIQSLSCVQLFSTPWTAADQACLSFTISWSLLKLMSIELVMASNDLFSVVPLSFCLRSFSASVYFPMNESVLHTMWSKYWSSSFSISPSNEHLVLISFRTDWFDHLAA